MVGFYVSNLTRDALRLLLGLEVDFAWVARGPAQSLDRLRRHGVRVFYPLGIFAARNQRERARYATRTADGQRVKTYAGWYTGLCPSYEQLRRLRLVEAARAYVSPLYNGEFQESANPPLTACSE